MSFNPPGKIKRTINMFATSTKIIEHFTKKATLKFQTMAAIHQNQAAKKAAAEI